jgi:O-antigen/teichoic acid export membrane protein
VSQIVSLRKRFHIGPVGRNAGFGTIGLGARALVQAAYLIVLSRLLGPTGYGLFSGTVASIMLVGPLAGWGAAYLVMKYVSSDAETSHSLWATALVQIASTGFVLTASVVLAISLGLPERLDAVSLAFLGLAELVVLPMAQAGSSLCFALERGVPAALNICLVPIARLFCAVMVPVCGFRASAPVFAASHFAGSLLGVAFCIGLIAHVDGLPDWRGRLRLGNALRQGSSYAIANLFNVSYLEVDKTVMLQLLGAAMVGPYTAAFRVMMVLVMPISALTGAALPRLFAEYERTGHSRMLGVMVASACGYALAAGVGALLVAPFMPRIFGGGFAVATHYVVLFAPWPLFFALHQCGVAALSASGRQNVRVMIEGGGFLTVVALNVLLLPRIGVSASVLALLIAEAAMALLCWRMGFHRRLPPAGTTSDA